MMKKVILSGVFLTLAFTVQITDVSADTIVEVAQSDSSFSTLVDLVVAADLANTLSSEGPFTVFAPTNEAFAALPPYIAALLEREPEMLTEILLYHVAAGELQSGDVVGMEAIETVQTDSVVVSAADGDYYINNSKLISLDVMAENGVVHVIDQVLIPRSVYQEVLNDIKAQLDQIQLLVAVFKAL